jgi:diadenosine tetraphosphate (Ap4A) HIT family hydrolase
MADQKDKPCPFCPVKQHEIMVENRLATVTRDSFPLTRGHALVIPRRHVASFFDTTPEEREAMVELLERAKLIIDKEHHPDGYNIGINDGAAAGQTVMHLHVHLIPRYSGDASDPRGGVRWIFPDRANYWKKES